MSFERTQVSQFQASNDFDATNMPGRTAPALQLMADEGSQKSEINPDANNLRVVLGTILAEANSNGKAQEHPQEFQQIQKALQSVNSGEDKVNPKATLDEISKTDDNSNTNEPVQRFAQILAGAALTPKIIATAGALLAAGTIAMKGLVDSLSGIEMPNVHLASKGNQKVTYVQEEMAATMALGGSQDPCDVLKKMYDEAKGDSKRRKDIKATQKAFDCRRSRNRK